VLVEFTGRAKRVRSRDVSEQLVDMLRGVVDRGTGQGVRRQFGIQLDVAGKTGTTQDNTDGWFILMHPRLVTGSWVGFNDARVTMRSSYWGQGAHNALFLSSDFLRQAASRRMIDAAAQFPKARDAWPGAAIWGPALDWLRGLLGEATPAHPRRPPAPPREEQADLSWLGRLQETITNVRDTIRAVENQWQRIQKMVDDFFGLFQ
jgi:penicillin-binding protein 1A